MITNKSILGIGLSALMLGTGVGEMNKSAHAEIVPQEPLQSEYKDGRYDSNTTHTSMGYREGLVTYDGNTIKKVNDYTNKYMYALKYETTTQRYTKSKDVALRNTVLAITSNGDYYQLPLRVNHTVLTNFNKNQYLSQIRLRYEFTKLLNQERAKVGAAPLEYSTKLQEGTDTRSQELANYGHIQVDGMTHVRLDKTPFYTAYEDIVINPQYRLGENLAMNSYYGNPYELVSEKHLAEKFFTQWKNSPGHYANMVNTTYKHYALSIKLSSDNKVSDYYDMFVGTTTFDNQ